MLKKLTHINLLNSVKQKFQSFIKPQLSDNLWGSFDK